MQRTFAKISEAKGVETNSMLDMQDDDNLLEDLVLNQEDGEEMAQLNLGNYFS